MRIAFTRWRCGGLLNRPSPRKRLLRKKKPSSGFEFVSGLAAGASAMPAKWSRRVFSFRFYEGKISVPVTLPSENHIVTCTETIEPEEVSIFGIAVGPERFYSGCCACVL